MVGSTWNCIKFYKIEADAQLKPVFMWFDSLNSDTDFKNTNMVYTLFILDKRKDTLGHAAINIEVRTCSYQYRG